MYQVWLESLDIYTSYCPETKIWACLKADNSVKIWWNLPINNPKQDLHNINHMPSLVKIHLCLLKLSSGNEIRTHRRTDVRLTDGRADRHSDVQHKTIIPRHSRIVGNNERIKTPITFDPILRDRQDLDMNESFILSLRSCISSIGTTHPFFPISCSMRILLITINNILYLGYVHGIIYDI